MTITEEWRETAVAELERRKMTRKELAQKAKCSQSSITNLFAKPVKGKPLRQAKQAIIEPVAKILGIPLPSGAPLPSDEEHTALVARVAAKLRWAIVHDRKGYDILEYQLLRTIAETRGADVETMTIALKSEAESAEGEEDAGGKGSGGRSTGGEGKPRQRRRPRS